jgi:hypothetical protein
MPQLDIVIFFNQFFWFFGAFFGVYIFIAYVIVPKINFYYFTRYNICAAFLQFENLLNLETSINLVSNQGVAELEYIYLFRLCWFEKIFSEFSFVFSPRGTEVSNMYPIVQMQNYVLLFLLRELS